MSYNIDRWKMKELTNFHIKLEALHEEEDYIDAPELDLSTGTLTFYGRSGGFELRGRQDGDVLVVEHIENHSEASGTLQIYLEENVFPYSTGYLHAVLVWERGDSITRLEVRDGVVTAEPIEL
jgi:hypothetical protein